MAQGNKVFSNFIWRLAEQCGAQGVSFIVAIVLARLLNPEDYGAVALLTVFTSILNVFVDSGMGNALIQKKNADNVDFSTVFFFNIIWCFFLYGILYIYAPLIAEFYDNDQLTALTRVAGLTIIISGVKNVQQAYVSRNMQFKKFFFATLFGTITSAILGIVMAYQGFGPWALVTQGITNAFIDTIFLWFTVRWRPQKVFQFSRLKKLFSFGWKLLISSLLDNIYNNVRQLIIGKMYSSSNLAYYNKGKSWPNLFITNINSSIDSVLLPTMSKVQDEAEQVKKMTRRAIKTSVYIMAPMMMGLAFIAKPLVSLVLTDKWLPCVPFMQIFCITYMFFPIHTANLNAIKAMGRSDLFLKLEVIKKFVGIILLLSTMWFGVMVMAYSLLVSSVISQIINSWPNRKLLNYSYIDQLKDIVPSILLSVFMGVCIYPLCLFHWPKILILFVQIVLGGVIYIIGSIILRLDSLQYLWKIISSILGKQFHFIKNKQKS